ncbi:hypothetical protein U1Q18_027084 [Sarracenia purpurea var. burkii]
MRGTKSGELNLTPDSSSVAPSIATNRSGRAEQSQSREKEDQMGLLRGKKNENAEEGTNGPKLETHRWIVTPAISPARKSRKDDGSPMGGAKLQKIGDIDKP